MAMSNKFVAIATAAASLDEDAQRLRNKNREYKLQLRRLTKAHRLLILEHKSLKTAYDLQRAAQQPYTAFMLTVDDAGAFSSKQVAVVG